MEVLGERRLLALRRWCRVRGFDLPNLARLANHSRFRPAADLSVARARWIVAYVRRQRGETP